jgi:hypothetical protein
MEHTIMTDDNMSNPWLGCRYETVVPFGYIKVSYLESNSTVGPGRSNYIGGGGGK